MFPLLMLERCMQTHDTANVEKEADNSLTAQRKISKWSKSLILGTIVCIENRQTFISTLFAFFSCTIGCLGKLSNCARVIVLSNTPKGFMKISNPRYFPFSEVPLKRVQSSHTK